MADKNNRKTSSGSASTKSEASTGSKSRSAALGTLSVGAIVGVLAAGVVGLLKLGKGRYTDGQPLAPGPQPKPVATPATGPAAAVDGQASDGSFGSGEHTPSDLMGDTHPGFEDRAVEAFRPDPTAAIPEGERDAFRPALAGASAPTLVKGQSARNERLDAAPS